MIKRVETSWLAFVVVAGLVGIKLRERVDGEGRFVACIINVVQLPTLELSHKIEFRLWKSSFDMQTGQRIGAQ